MDEPTPVQRILNSFWDKLPLWMVAALLAIVGFLGGLWLSDRELRDDLSHVQSEQESGRLCSRIGECALCAKVVEQLAEARQLAANMDVRFSTHLAERQEWRDRTRELERRVNDLSARATAGSDTRALEDRIRQLERKP